jgi:flagellar biosynthesis protein FliR
MKPINEIRLKLCELICCILLPLFADCYPPGSGWFGLCMMILTCLIGIVAGCFVTNFLIAFKKWWKE